CAAAVLRLGIFDPTSVHHCCQSAETVGSVALGFTSVGVLTFPSPQRRHSSTCGAQERPQPGQIQPSATLNLRGSHEYSRPNVTELLPDCEPPFARNAKIWTRAAYPSLRNRVRNRYSSPPPPTFSSSAVIRRSSSEIRPLWACGSSSCLLMAESTASWITTSVCACSRWFSALPSRTSVRRSPSILITRAPSAIRLSSPCWGWWGVYCFPGGGSAARAAFAWLGRRARRWRARQGRHR